MVSARAKNSLTTITAVDDVVKEVRDIKTKLTSHNFLFYYQYKIKKWDLTPISWRPRRELHPRIRVLQTLALLLGYVAETTPIIPKIPPM